MRAVLSRLAALALLCSSFGCGPNAGGGRQPATLAVFAAASLTRIFTQLRDSLRARAPGLRVDFNFAGSQVLALQITRGATADVFASADAKWMQFVEDSGGVAGAPQTFTFNRLTVIVPRENPGRIERLEDLARSGVKLVLAGEEVPAGRYAREVIANLSRAPEFPAGYRQRVLANVVSNEETVKGVVTKVELGEADAGLVYVTDVTPEVSARVRRIEIPEDRNVVARYPVAVLRQAKNPAAAREFVDLLLSPVGKRVLEANGFSLRPPSVLAPN